MRNPPQLLATATLVGLAAGCGGAAHSVETESARASSPPRVANPFTIVDRYSAASLGLHKPRDLAIGPDGNLYIAEAADDITVISPAGRVLHRWGRKGKGPAEFNFATASDPAAPQTSIAVGPGGQVYVSDTGNARVEVFSSTGRFIRSIGSFGLNNGQFQAPLALAADAAGNVYVADDQRETLSKFSPSGRFEWSVGGPGTTDPDLLGHFDSLGVDAHGRVVAAVDDTHAVVYLDAAGNKVDAFSTQAYFSGGWGPCNLALTPTGDVVVESCPDAGTPVPGVASYRATLLFDRTHRLIGAWYGSPFSDFVGPHFGPRGEIFAMGAELPTASPNGSILRVKVAVPGA